ncbi:hypothetical protein [Streptomyces sp. SAI-149]|uniref:hypothetical protein n=1 Tax=Streptomyces sp. SAI-149 TaxID=2940542 RepID=UPI0024741B27|nr:hypothetical protein [Streptomyces sp. SAI-149]MDH6502482.1 hypothetical protein [Streptomyces sp. SAI-149]
MLHLLELAAWIDDDLSGQEPLHFTVDRQTCSLSPRPVEGEHEEVPQAFVEGVSRNKLLQIDRCRGGASEFQFRSEPVGLGLEAEMFKDVPMRVDLWQDEALQCLVLPQCQRVVQMAGDIGRSLRAGPSPPSTSAI